MRCFVGLGEEFTSEKAPSVANCVLARGRVVFCGVRSHIYLRESPQIRISRLGRGVAWHFVGLGEEFISGKAPPVPN